MDRRFFLTVVVCIAILALWQTFVAPPPKRITTDNHAVNQNPQSTSPNDSQPTISPQTIIEPKNPAMMGADVASYHEKTSSFENDLFSAEVTTTGGGLRHFVLKQFKEGARKRKQEKHPVSLVSAVDEQEVPTAQLLLAGAPVLFSEVQATTDGADLKGEQSGLAIHLHWQTQLQAYLLKVTTDIENKSAQPIEVATSFKLQGIFNERAVKDRSMFEPPPDILTAVALSDQHLVRHTIGKKDDVSTQERLFWAGIDRQYFLFAAAPTTSDRQNSVFSEDREIKDSRLLHVATTLSPVSKTLAPGQKTHLEYQIFAGPKEVALLKAPGLHFEDAIDYNVWGMPLAFIARPMLWVLNTSYRIFHSYGVAIIILTLVVKLLMLPVTQRAFISMQRMRELKPELDKIKERFPNDREKQGMETMRLYKERNVNPFLSGCLPMLLQMPVYIALWRTLWVAVELYQKDFLWLSDLTARDPYFVLPATLGLSIFLQNKLSPPVGDAQQQKIMTFMMPAMMTLFMVQLPAGLVFYSLVNTLLTIAQQAYINKRFSNTSTIR